MENIAGRQVLQPGAGFLPDGIIGWVALCPSEDRVLETFPADAHEAATMKTMEHGKALEKLVVLCADYGPDAPMRVNFTY